VPRLFILDGAKALVAHRNRHRIRQGADRPFAGAIRYGRVRAVGRDSQTPRPEATKGAARCRDEGNQSGSTICCDACGTAVSAYDVVRAHRHRRPRTYPRSP
jgi:hypothetical protein